MYQWRLLSDDERREVLAARQRAQRPWHRPPHFQPAGPAQFHITAACYEHAAHIGRAPARMDAFANHLLATCDAAGAPITAWCLLPNHYHLLLHTPNLRQLTTALGRLHGRSSHAWNREEQQSGRRVFHGAADRHIRSDDHFWATLNYIHHNPVRHGYVTRWTDWPWSSASEYLKTVGHDEAERVWRTYPLLDYGAGWDDPHL
jgi:putative transposase